MLECLSWSQHKLHAMSQHILWQLSPEQKKAALQEGKRRQRTNETKGLRGRNNGPAFGDNAELIHVLGAGGEMAVASYLGLTSHLFKENDAVRGSSDLPFSIDVKTRSRHYYDLICLLDESPEKILVLVTVENKEIRIHGWILARDAKKEQWKKEYVAGRPCYFVPKNYLLPMEALWEKVNETILLRLRETRTKTLPLPQAS